MMDRRESPRVKFAKKSVYTVKLVLKRYFLRDKVILCILRNFSDGGASLLVRDEFAKFITKANIGQRVCLISENSEISFRVKKKGKILRIIENYRQVSIVVIFQHKAA